MKKGFQIVILTLNKYKTWPISIFAKEEKNYHFKFYNKIRLILDAKKLFILCEKIILNNSYLLLKLTSGSLYIYIYFFDFLLGVQNSWSPN